MIEKIVNYTVAEGNSRGALVAKVQELLSDGWIPQGGVTYCVREGPSGSVYEDYAQAMVLIEKINHYEPTLS